jgi:flagellar biosynthesis protein FlhB
MAEERDDADKTEDPTLKRLDDALKRGDVAKSQEVNTWFVIAAAALVMVGFSGSLAAGLTTTLRGLMGNAHRVSFDRGGLFGLVEKIGFEVLASVAVPVLVLVIGAIAGNVIQHQLVWSGEQLKPTLSKTRRSPAPSACSRNSPWSTSPRASPSWC